MVLILFALTHEIKIQFNNMKKLRVFEKVEQPIDWVNPWKKGQMKYGFTVYPHNLNQL